MTSWNSNKFLPDGDAGWSLKVLEGSLVSGKLNIVSSSSALFDKPEPSIAETLGSINLGCWMLFGCFPKPDIPEINPKEKDWS